MQFGWETKEIAWIKVSENQMQAQKIRACSWCSSVLKIQIIQFFIYTCSIPLKHQRALAQLVVCLPISALCHVVHLMVMGSTPIRTTFFSLFHKTSYFFMFFLQNFNNFFNQSKLLILRWFFAHLSFNIYILWLCQKNPKIFSSD